MRNFGKVFGLFFLFLVAAIFVTEINAQGVILPIPCDVRPCRPLPPRPVPIPRYLKIKSIKLDTKIVRQVATTRVEQIFRNDTPYTLEGTYFFPIPETASIVEFAIWENGKKLVGEVRSREEARRIYDEIVRRQRDPGLLEYAGKNLFQASIFPIPPNSDKKLELVYSEVLKADSGTISYRYPLGIGRNLINQIPSPIERRDISYIETSDFNADTVVSGKIEIEEDKALKTIYSPTHSVDSNHKKENSAIITFEEKGKAKTDFQLYYGVSNEDFGLSLLTHREPGKDGYFLLILTPKDKILESEIVAKDIVFVLDTSGSMGDEGKMEKARAALLFGIRNLRDADRFNVISFAGEEHLMESGLIRADANGKKRGEEFVKKLTANGGTNINDALAASIKQFDAQSARTKLLVFMTDGLPTVGETNIEKIVQNVQTRKIENLRLFSFGVGYDVNTVLLDKIAAENSGTAEYVEPKEDLEVKVSNFFAKVNSPVLTNIELNLGAAQTELLYPRRLPDLFRGSQLTILGRYKNSADLRNVTLLISGRAGTEQRGISYNHLSFPLRSEENEFLPRLWATRRVGWLIEQIRLNGEQKELRDEVVELGTRYGIVTPYTSYLATDGSNNRVSRDDFERSMPSSVTPKRSAENLSMMQSGADAVRIAKDSKAKRESEIVSKEESNQVKIVGNKTFYLDENGVWIDSEYRTENKLTEVKIKFASKEYFDLLTAEKDLAAYLAVGEKTIFVWKGKVYRIVE